MKLEVGKTYRTRDGKRVFKITTKCGFSNMQHFGGSSGDGV